MRKEKEQCTRKRGMGEISTSVSGAISGCIWSFHQRSLVGHTDRRTLSDQSGVSGIMGPSRCTQQAGRMEIDTSSACRRTDRWFFLAPGGRFLRPATTDLLASEQFRDRRENRAAYGCIFIRTIPCYSCHAWHLPRRRGAGWSVWDHRLPTMLSQWSWSQYTLHSKSANRQAAEASSSGWVQ